MALARAGLLRRHSPRTSTKTCRRAERDSRGVGRGTLPSTHETGAVTGAEHRLHTPHAVTRRTRNSLSIESDYSPPHLG